MSFVFVLDSSKQPLNSVHPAEARLLLGAKKAAVFRRFPFTIILKEAIKLEPKPLTIKIDPGARYTGLAIVNEASGQVVFAAEIEHRGFQIRDALTSRRQLRRTRRNRKTRYRQARFLNRSRPKGSLPPSLNSRVENILTWVRRLTKFCSINSIAVELVKFDTQLMQDSNISGVAYKQGTLMGYEVREFLLERWQRQCAYCNVKDVPLEVEHVQPRSKGGSDRISNLTLACHACNQEKGNRDLHDFLSGKQDLLQRILAQTKKPLADTAAARCCRGKLPPANSLVNATRWELFHRLKDTGLQVFTGTGGQTKFNRTNFGLVKTHWIDAACVGATLKLTINGIKPLKISAKGHGTRQICRTDKYGFPIRHCSRIKLHKGFQTGDIVKAIVTKGKKIGVYIGRVATRATGSFNISTATGLVQGISYKYCVAIHCKDGYSYVA